ncbi:VHS domain-containing protein [Corchorus olitorius]|uniref:VHS domain-containing protein n=1 Tax=Corchorus olitorius TaxID=93759 RepID=A0A1R3L0E5_9ROSI|nr:VHS domain-containing protein [Corchorus olitorius]
MAAELVNSATSEKLIEMDWTKNIEICELVARDQRQAKDVVKAIKKRLGSKNPSTQLYAVLLLEMLMNNIGENVHKQVIDIGILPILVKIVKKKSELPVRERIFLLLDATQTSLGGASGRFPQYYSAYYDLVVELFNHQNPNKLSKVPRNIEHYCPLSRRVLLAFHIAVGLRIRYGGVRQMLDAVILRTFIPSWDACCEMKLESKEIEQKLTPLMSILVKALVEIMSTFLESVGVQFPQRSHATPSDTPTSLANTNNTLNGQLASARHEAVAQQAETKSVPESR